jgi:protein-S-isoprenylcysteine O-methyltransferase Ste14
MPDGIRRWGDRGEWYVVIQIALFLAIGFGPRTWTPWPSGRFPEWPWVSAASIVLMIAGVALAFAGVLRIGSRLTALPYPAADAILQEAGPYRVVRHPMYSGGILAALGWALFSRSELRLVEVGFLILLFDLKARREERWLIERFPAYADYRRRVRRLIPFLY